MPTPASSPAPASTDPSRLVDALEAPATLVLTHESPDVVQRARELLELVLDGAGARELEAAARAFRFACAGVAS
jgi:hypothetical protein